MVWWYERFGDMLPYILYMQDEWEALQVMTYRDHLSGVEEEVTQRGQLLPLTDPTLKKLHWPTRI